MACPVISPPCLIFCFFSPSRGRVFHPKAVRGSRTRGSQTWPECKMSRGSCLCTRSPAYALLHCSAEYVPRLVVRKSPPTCYGGSSWALRRYCTSFRICRRCPPTSPRLGGLDISKWPPPIVRQRFSQVRATPWFVPGGEEASCLRDFPAQEPSCSLGVSEVLHGLERQC